MKKLENVISEGMQLIENLAVNIQNELSGDIEFEELEEGELEWVGSYELDDIIFRAFQEEAICDYFADYLSEEIEDIEQSYKTLCQVYIEDDELIIYFGN
jgi:hypothetical protein